MEYQPINKKEKSILDQLIENGLDENEIEFRGDSNHRYIRYGYWSRLNETESKNVNLEEDLYEDDDGDDDNGRSIIRRLYSYIIK